MGSRLVGGHGTYAGSVQSAKDFLDKIQGARDSANGAKPVATAGTSSGYLERVVKYIPSEVVGAYVVVNGIAPDPANKAVAWPAALYLGIYGALLVLTPLYLTMLGGEVRRKGIQIALGTVAFAVWTYAIGGPLMAAIQIWVNHVIVYGNLGSILLVLSTLGFGAFDPAKPSTAL